MQQGDYSRFLALLYRANQIAPVDKFGGLTSDNVFLEERGERIVDIGAYCLMPNHVHLLLKERVGGGISKFMQKLTTGYTMYFNASYERTGSLFQGTFKAKHVDSDRYLRYLISYIHLNPIKLIDPKWKENGIADRSSAERYLRQYSYSSYRDYLGDARPVGAILSPSSLPEYFSSGADFEEQVTEWLTYKTDSSEV